MGSNIHREENKNVDFISMSEYLSQNVPIDYVRRLKVDTERLYLFLKESNSRQSEARKSKSTKRQQLEDAAQRKPLEVANDPMTYTCWIGYIERLSKVHCFNRPDRRTRNNAQSSKNQINVSAFQHNHPPSSDSIERLFSDEALILTKKRRRLYMMEGFSSCIAVAPTQC